MKILSRLFGFCLLLAVFVLPAASAQGGTFKIRSCYPPNNSTVLGNFSTNAPGVFSYQDFCSTSSSVGWGYWLWNPSQAYNGDVGRLKWTAPSGMGFTAGPTGAGANSDPDFLSRVIYHNNGANPVVNANPPAGETRTDFEYNLKCNASSCHYGHILNIRNVELVVKDSQSPAVAYSGSLFSGGIVSGTRTAEPIGADGESGIHRVMLLVNGVWAGISQAPNQTSGVSCDPSAPTYNAYEPCPHLYSKQWSFNTAQAPFKNGTNIVASCTTDYSGNSSCSPGVTVNISN